MAWAVLTLNPLMTYLGKMIFAMAAAALVSVAGVQASSYQTGSILVSGSVAFNTGSSGTATQLLGWFGDNGSGNALVQGANGNFLSYAGTTALSGSAWNFGGNGDPTSFTAAPPTTGFLTVGTMTFYLKDWSIQSQVLSDAFNEKDPLGALTISGNGFVSGPGFLTTFGTWIFSTVDADGLNKASFSFLANGDGINPAPVPDGGTTVALLGLVLGALALVQRKLRFAEGRNRAAARC
jgi:hypothetical protein